MILLFTSQDHAQVHILKGLLESVDIPTAVLDQDSATAFGSVGYAPMRVMVRAEDKVIAEAVLADFLASLQGE